MFSKYVKKEIVTIVDEEKVCVCVCVCACVCVCGVSWCVPCAACEALHSGDRD